MKISSKEMAVKKLIDTGFKDVEVKNVNGE